MAKKKRMRASKQWGKKVASKQAIKKTALKPVRKISRREDILEPFVLALGIIVIAAGIVVMYGTETNRLSEGAQQCEAQISSSLSQNSAVADYKIIDVKDISTFQEYQTIAVVYGKTANPNTEVKYGYSIVVGNVTSIAGGTLTNIWLCNEDGEYVKVLA
ncbi:MAG: hypothetical protein V1911_01220 [Candidatus Micrarchaeota archaeon]